MLRMKKFVRIKYENVAITFVVWNGWRIKVFQELYITTDFFHKIDFLEIV